MVGDGCSAASFGCLCLMEKNIIGVQIRPQSPSEAPSSVDSGIEGRKDALFRPQKEPGP